MKTNLGSFSQVVRVVDEGIDITVESLWVVREGKEGMRQ